MKKQKIVVLTGAGISAESGLKTFRDSDGLWEGHNVEDVATLQAWHRNREMVLRFYNERRKNVREVQPNIAHFALARLEELYDVQIVTQNIDDLHERAGSTKVLHLHGEIFKMRSEKAGHEERHALRIDGDISPGDLAPDGGQYRPHIVWFGEAVPAIPEAARMMAEADIFILAGTSLAVYPAAGLIDFVEPAAPKYIVDKRIPDVSRYRNIIPVQKPATVGMQDVLTALGMPPVA
jgi:NAD-dependent deacetylase